ncbi:MAG TPA: nuclear transport factor 2 family protein [Pseudonocardiaceae bacterium]|jgi:uncharacterized protein (TIGR02246 family)|nr:nuclear transport factor 2 family protein [Pseudonocardiaceae bacterium]
MSSETRVRAGTPEDLTRLFVELANAGDAAGMAQLYEPDAVLDYPVGRPTVGRAAIRAVFERMVAQRPTFAPEESLPTLRTGDIALTATRPRDDTGGRAQVVRRQPDGCWLRVLDRPEAR